MGSHRRAQLIAFVFGFLAGFAYFQFFGEEPPADVVRQATFARSVSDRIALDETFEYFGTLQQLRINATLLENVISQQQWSSGVENIFLLVVLKSSPGNVERREAVRQSWFIADNKTKRATSSRLVRQFFAVGQSLDEKVEKRLVSEQKVYGDLLRVPMRDSYDHLTVKTLWSISYAIGSYDFQFLLIADDDTFVNWLTFLPWLAKLPQEKVYAGRLHPTGRVDRDPKSKWFVPREVYAADSFPPYAVGTGFVLSFDVAQLCVEIARQRPLLGIDDAMVGWLVSEAKIAARHEEKIVLKWDCKVPFPLLLGGLSIPQMIAAGKNARQRIALC